MNVLKIKANCEEILIYTDTDGSVVVRESVPTISEKPGRTLSTVKTAAVNGVITLPRHENVNDRIYSHYTVYSQGKEASGVCYVTEVDAGMQENTMPYPQPAIIKTLGAPPELSEKLNIQQGRLDISLPCLMTTVPGDDTLPYDFNGRTYYFRRSAVEQVDKQMRSVPISTMILLNSPKLFGSTQEQALLDACVHPHYDWECPNAYISAFDMETEEGQGYYGAFVEFLVERYTRPDKKYGCAVGAIISNEVNSQYVWGNAGEMPVEKYVKEYTQAMRLAWICGRKHCGHFRVYISLDQFWCGANFNPSQPERYYSGRVMLELLNSYATAEGNFDWGVAYHPYPEDLRCPDFWNDRAPDFTFSTPKITFKNIEVLEAFLSQPAFLYNGTSRRIVFSEQGFNSQNGPLQALTEKMAAAAYVLAYMKARNMKTVDMMTHHSCVDNPHEFGLNLGIFRYDPSRSENVGEPKPIFESFSAMDTPDEPTVVKKARSFIGEELFDYLLHPPLVYGDRDTSEDDAFGG